MTEQEIYSKLSKQSPTGYKLNELIPFSYPVRRIRLDVLVNKQPDGSLVNVYNIILRAIHSGFQTQKELFAFLGLGDTDEFILRELFALREKNYANVVSEKWYVTEAGEQFLKDTSIMRVEEEEEFEFLLDGISGEPISIKQHRFEKSRLNKYLPTEYKDGNRSPDLLDGKYQQLSDIYKSEHEGKAYLIGYSQDEIKYDSYRDNESGMWCNYWLVEYIPDRTSNQEARLEVRHYDTLTDNKQLTAKFNAEYRNFIYALNPERNAFADVAETIVPVAEAISVPEFATLSIWETKQKFIESLKNVKEKILIESPWIKRATKEYIPYFENLLKANKRLIILYGIDINDEHDLQTLEQVKQLENQHKKNFTLIHLPSHLKTRGSRLTGTHRKLLIKDNDFYVAGSFNFLSFGKNEKQLVANEESMFVSRDVAQKWAQVIKEYGLPI